MWGLKYISPSVFREPDAVLPKGVPRLLLSESDFHDPDRNDSGTSRSQTNALPSTRYPLTAVTTRGRSLTGLGIPYNSEK